MPSIPLTEGASEGARPRIQGAITPWVVALGGMISLSVAMGIGRFAFTPLLPMMLHDGAVTLARGSWLATSNYFGYLMGAFLGMALPWVAPRVYAVMHPARIAWTGLIATVLLTAAMAFDWPAAWPVLRFLAGVGSAITFLGTTSWCMVRLTSLGRPALAGLIFTGPGAGILVTGLLASGMVAAQWRASSGWWMFAGLALVLCALIWPVMQGLAPVHAGDGKAVAHTLAPAEPVAARVVHAVAYGLSGFGYIITATFLPVIARAAMPGQSAWADLFWPIAGAAVMVGALVSTRLHVRLSRRWLLVVSYLIQAAGVALSMYLPTTLGFVLSSILVGLPFTAISFFALQEALRIWPASADSFAGMVTGVYGIGQIAGPPLVAWLLAHAPQGKGFDLALECAALTLVLGAAMYAFSLWRWPEKRDLY